jgi:hypothetical protein
MGVEGETVERMLGALARPSHGVVTRAQLVRAGISRREIERRVESGLLIPEHRGVYRVGHRAPSVEARYLAAVLACGEGAVLSGRAAAHFYGLLNGPTPAPEVTAPKHRNRSGVLTRWQPAGIHRLDVTTYKRIPITTVPRTVVDLAGVLDSDALARVFHEAAMRHRVTPAHVEVVLARRPNSPGAKVLKEVLRGNTRVLLSQLERAFIALLRDADLPLPQTNRRAGSHLVDCRWPDRKLTIELDSYRYHHTRHAWDQDRNREREAHEREDSFRRYTWGDVFERPAATLSDLRRLLPP